MVGTLPIVLSSFYLIVKPNNYYKIEIFKMTKKNFSIKKKNNNF